MFDLIKHSSIHCKMDCKVTVSDYKWLYMHQVKPKTADFDACSLYPSVMFFMDGFLEGLPKVLTTTSYDFLNSQDGYLSGLRLLW